MSDPSWTKSPETWNTVILGDVTLPGFCVVEFEIADDIEIVRSKGKNGARCKSQGRMPAEFDVLVTLVNDQHWTDWQAAFPKLNPRRANAIKNPLEIRHPDINNAGIKNVLVHKIRSSPATARDGKKYTLRLIEWYPELVKQVAASKAAKPAVTNATKPKSVWDMTAEELVYTPIGPPAEKRMFGPPAPPTHFFSP